MDEGTEQPKPDAGEQPPDDTGGSAATAETRVDVEAGDTGRGTAEGSSGPEPAPDQRDLAAILEALLFVSPEPLGIDRLTGAVDGATKAEVKAALALLRESMERQERAVQLVQVAGGYQIRTKPEYGPWIKRLEKTKTAPKLSRSALESLAIIAYKQPLTRAEIEHIRGVETSGVLRTLLERRLVRIVGRKEVPGRPILYGTTRQFLQQFGLNSLGDLPPLREFKELGQAEQSLLPIGDEPLVIGEGESQPGDSPEGSTWPDGLPQGVLPVSSFPHERA